MDDTRRREESKCYKQKNIALPSLKLLILHSFVVTKGLEASGKSTSEP